MSVRHELKRFDFGDLELQSGQILEDGFLTYSTHGTLNTRRDNAILVLPSLMADHTRHDFLIGPGKAFDPERHFIITTNTLGNGRAISPSNSARQPGAAFPRFTIVDMVRAQHRLARDVFGIDQFLAVAGLSMGGMQTLQWAVAFPTAMKAIVPIITQARATPWVSAYWHAMRKPILESSTEDDRRDALCRSLYHFLLMTRHWIWYQGAFENDIQELYRWMDAEARRIASLWHPFDFISQTYAEDDYDLTHSVGVSSVEEALSLIEARVLLMPSATDILHPASELHFALPHLKNARLVEIPSSCGHLGGGGLDPQDAAFMNREIASFLAEVEAAG